jgi:enoyl-CoA hydratase
MSTKYDHFKTMKFSLENRVITATLNNSDKLNIFTEEMEFELSQFLVDGGFDKDFDIAVLTGAGKAFSAGGDIENWMLRNVEDPRRVDHNLSKRLVFALIDFPKPLIAKVNGHAIGLGCTCALFCDVIFASDRAKFADPHVKIGLSAGDGGAIIWPQLIGYARAREFLMTGAFIPAQRAAEMGLINYCLPPEELDARVDAFVKELQAGALVAISATKKTVNLGLKQLASAIMDASIAYETITVASADHAEAVHAFLEKREPKFTGS